MYILRVNDPKALNKAPQYFEYEKLGACFDAWAKFMRNGYNVVFLAEIKLEW